MSNRVIIRGSKAPGYSIHVYLLGKGDEKMAIAVPFGRCLCLAKLGWCWPCSLPSVFAGLAAGMRKRPSGPALYWRGEEEAEEREANHQELHR